MKDARRQPVALGDLLLDDRGKVWRVLPTEATFAAQTLAAVQELRQRGRERDLEAVGQGIYLRLPQAIKVAEQDVGSARENRELYRQVYAQHIRPRRREEIQKRRARVQSLISDRL